MKYCTVCNAKYEDSVSFCPVDGEVLEDDPSSIVNTVLDGQYQVESMLGKGGMGAVYKARHILLGDRVAIKIMPPEVRNNAEWLRRFRREGQAARRFRHPNSVTVYDLRTAGDGTIYMVMEYVDGHTLDAEIKRRGRLSPTETFAILEPILSVLDTAHSMGVVHRDLKPENIMIGKANNNDEPIVKLLDLGIAKMREIAGADSGGTTALTMAGQVLGTPYYMSPEQWGELPRDGNSELDGRADIYSLGLVFYEMVSGRRPYSGRTLLELRKAHLSTTPPPLHEIVPSVSRAFSDVIARAVAKDRADRQATAAQFAAELRAALKAEPQPGPMDRTIADFSSPGSASETSGINKAADTKSDLDAPTIITIDAAPVTTEAPPNAAAVTADTQVAPNPSEAVPAVKDVSVVQSKIPGPVPTIAESAFVAPNVVAPILQPQPQVSSEKSGKKPIIAIAAVVIVLVLVLGLGGLYALSRLRGSSDAATDKKTGGNAGGTGAEAPAKEFGKYWLELPSTSSGGEPLRVAGVVPLASGQSFKFHFDISQDGYLYIIGPGEQNLPTAFLTTKPFARSGLTTNQVSQGSDFSFPSGKENWLELDKKPGTEDYTIIFSSKQLPAPKLFNEPVTGNPLSDADQKEVSQFLTQYQANAPKTELNNKDANEPFVTMKMPQASASGDPVVFKIRIQHK